MPDEMKVVALSARERRILTVAMAAISLQNTISMIGDDELIRKMEETLDEARDEWNQLAENVDHNALIEKLASPLDPPEEKP